MTSELLVERRNGYEIWLLNRPARRNAMSIKLLSALTEAHQNTKQSGIDTIVLGAVGDTFCAGFDLDDLKRLGTESGVLPRSPLHEFLARFSPPSCTLITAIQGSAYGGGVELALLGDLCIATPSATFLLPPAKLGIIYPQQGLTRLREALGTPLLRAMLVSALPVSATRLHQQGAIWSIEEDPLSVACSLAERISHFPAHARLNNINALRSV